MALSRKKKIIIGATVGVLLLIIIVVSVLATGWQELPSIRCAAVFQDADPAGGDL